MIRSRRLPRGLNHADQKLETKAGGSESKRKSREEIERVESGC